MIIREPENIKQLYIDAVFFSRIILTKQQNIEV